MPRKLYMKTFGYDGVRHSERHRSARTLIPRGHRCHVPLPAPIPYLIIGIRSTRKGVPHRLVHRAAILITHPVPELEDGRLTPRSR